MSSSKDQKDISLMPEQGQRKAPQILTKVGQYEVSSDLSNLLNRAHAFLSEQEGYQIMGNQMKQQHSQKDKQFQYASNKPDNQRIQKNERASFSKSTLMDQKEKVDMSPIRIFQNVDQSLQPQSLQFSKIGKKVGELSYPQPTARTDQNDGAFETLDSRFKKFKFSETERSVNQGNQFSQLSPDWSKRHTSRWQVDTKPHTYSGDYTGISNFNESYKRTLDCSPIGSQNQRPLTTLPFTSYEGLSFIGNRPNSYQEQYGKFQRVPSQTIGNNQSRNLGQNQPHVVRNNNLTALESEEVIEENIHISPYVSHRPYTSYREQVFQEHQGQRPHTNLTRQGNLSNQHQNVSFLSQNVNLNQNLERARSKGSVSLNEELKNLSISEIRRPHYDNQYKEKRILRKLADSKDPIVVYQTNWICVGLLLLLLLALLGLGVFHVRNQFKLQDSMAVHQGQSEPGTIAKPVYPNAEEIKNRNQSKPSNQSLATNQTVPVVINISNLTVITPPTQIKNDTKIQQPILKPIQIPAIQTPIVFLPIWQQKNNHSGIINQTITQPTKPQPSVNLSQPSTNKTGESNQTQIISPIKPAVIPVPIIPSIDKNITVQPVITPTIPNINQTISSNVTQNVTQTPIVSSNVTQKPSVTQQNDSKNAYTEFQPIKINESSLFTGYDPIAAEIYFPVESKVDVSTKPNTQVQQINAQVSSNYQVEAIKNQYEQKTPTIVPQQLQIPSTGQISAKIVDPNGESILPQKSLQFDTVYQPEQKQENETVASIEPSIIAQQKPTFPSAIPSQPITPVTKPQEKPSEIPSNVTIIEPPLVQPTQISPTKTNVSNIVIENITKTPEGPFPAMDFLEPTNVTQLEVSVSPIIQMAEQKQTIPSERVGSEDIAPIPTLMPQVQNNQYMQTVEALPVITPSTQPQMTGVLEPQTTPIPLEPQGITYPTTIVPTQIQLPQPIAQRNQTADQMIPGNDIKYPENITKPTVPSTVIKIPEEPEYINPQNISEYLISVSPQIQRIQRPRPIDAGIEPNKGNYIEPVSIQPQLVQPAQIIPSANRIPFEVEPSEAITTQPSFVQPTQIVNIPISPSTTELQSNIYAQPIPVRNEEISPEQVQTTTPQTYPQISLKPLPFEFINPQPIPQVPSVPVESPYISPMSAQIAPNQINTATSVIQPGISPVPTTSQFPISAQPLQIQPISVQPVSIEPVSTASPSLPINPISIEPLPIEPVSIEPAEIQPDWIQPNQIRPNQPQQLPALPIQTKPLEIQPISAQPIYPQPIPTSPISLEPIPAQPISSQPISLEPITDEPISPQYIASQPIQAQPLGITPTLIDNNAIPPLTIDPSKTIQPIQTNLSIPPTTSQTDIQLQPILTQTQIPAQSWIPPQQISSIPPQQTSSIPPQQISSIPPQQISSIPPQIMDLNQNYLPAQTAPQPQQIQPSKITDASIDQITQKSKDFQPYIFPENVKRLTPLDGSEVVYEIPSDFDKSQLPELEKQFLASYNRTLSNRSPFQIIPINSKTNPLAPQIAPLNFKTSKTVTIKPEEYKIYYNNLKYTFSKLWPEAVPLNFKPKQKQDKQTILQVLDNGEIKILQKGYDWVDVQKNIETYKKYGPPTSYPPNIRSSAVNHKLSLRRQA